MSPWRPTPRLRAVAIGVVWRGSELLVSAVLDDDSRKGWRPLGGGVEFGETSRQAVVREMHEELGAAFRPTRLLGVIESVFEHHGEPGHEIVFAWEGAFDDPGLAASDAFVVAEGPRADHAEWRGVAAFRAGEALFPGGLLALVAPTA